MQFAHGNLRHCRGKRSADRFLRLFASRFKIFVELTHWYYIPDPYLVTHYGMAYNIVSGLQLLSLMF